MTKPRAARKAKVILRVLSLGASRGRLQYGAFDVPCALGRSGVKSLKRESDGASPRGAFVIRRVLFNGARTERPRTAFSVVAIKSRDGWCDSPGDRNYNRPVCLPYAASHERLWRDDGLYDIVVVLGYNDVPRVSGRGSAIFMHVARQGLAPTEGCIAVARVHLHRLLAMLPRRAEVIIG